MHAKIRELKEKLEPNNIPSEVALSRNFICGSSINREQFLQKLGFF